MRNWGVSDSSRSNRERRRCSFTRACDRRTAVRNLERAGVSRAVAMKLTGHKTEAVYRRFAIVDEVALREGVAKLARLGTEWAPEAHFGQS